MGSDSINEMFQKHLLEEGHLHYGEFMNDLSRLIVSFVFLLLFTSLICYLVLEMYMTIDPS